MFAKLYEIENIGQVLVKLDQSESDDHSGPEIRYYFEAPNLGVCSAATKYKDSETGWDAAESAFANVTQESAEKLASGVINGILSEFSSIEAEQN